MTDRREDRWDRLQADLAAAGIEARVDRKPYVEERYGRIEHGVSSSIFIRTETGAVCVSDKHGRGGKWYGWTVWAEDREGITIGRPTWAQTKRSVTVAEVQAKLA